MILYQTRIAPNLDQLDGRDEGEYVSIEKEDWYVYDGADPEQMKTLKTTRYSSCVPIRYYRVITTERSIIQLSTENDNVGMFKLLSAFGMEKYDNSRRFVCSACQMFVDGCTDTRVGVYCLVGKRVATRAGNDPPFTHIDGIPLEELEALNMVK